MKVINNVKVKWTSFIPFGDPILARLPEPCDRVTRWTAPSHPGNSRRASNRFRINAYKFALATQKRRRRRARSDNINYPRRSVEAAPGVPYIWPCICAFAIKACDRDVECRRVIILSRCIWENLLGFFGLFFHLQRSHGDFARARPGRCCLRLPAGV